MIVDANILLYAVDSACAQHDRARTWLEQALNGPGRVGLPWPSLTAFLRIATHPRASADPLSQAEAWGFVEDWLGAGPAYLRGNLVADAHLAALAVEHGVGVCSADSDFARFAGVEWFNPVAAGT